MTDKPTLKERFIARFFGDTIAELAQTAAISIRIDDSAGWDQIGGTRGPHDRNWAERRDDLDEALEAWRKNFLVRRIVALTRSYVIGSGITVTSRVPDVDQFIAAFWNHPKNLIARRLGPMCDELTRSGELFPILFTNRVDGMSYVRFVPASQIREIETNPDDYETELRYAEIQANEIEPRWWYGPGHKYAFRRTRGGPGGKLHPLMLHFAVNRPIGAIRGEGDLVVVLPWAKRYSEWLKDRVRLNRQRTRQGMLDVTVADDTVEAKRKQLARTNPIEAGIYVHGTGEEVAMHKLEIRADDVKDDGRALRLAIATGANSALHYLGEGESVNYSTAKEMGEPTARFYTDRQDEISGFLLDLVETAYKRAVALDKLPALDDLQLMVHTTEVARADNENLAKAAQSMVEALSQMRVHGWIDDHTAIKLAFKFAGETLSEDKIAHIIETSKPIDQPEKENDVK